MNFITYNNQKYKTGLSATKAVSKREGKLAAEKFYNEVIYPSDFCLRCVVTNQKLTYKTYKMYGNRCGSAVNLLLRKHKDVKLVKKIIDETLFYVEELNGYFSEWIRMSGSAASLKYTPEQKKMLYDKYILNNSKCKLSTCSNKVPYEHVQKGTCCLLHHSRNLSLKTEKYTTDDLKYECKLDGEKFTCLSRLSKYVKSKGWTEEQYHKTFINSSATGTCLWCCKPVPFHNIEKGYRNFCHNSSCNVYWHNKFENRHDNGEKISKKQKEAQNMPNQKGYWLKRGYTEEEATLKVRERQTTNSVKAIAKRKNCSLEEAIKIRSDITKKWSESFPNLNYSHVSQKLFWSIYEIIKNKFPEIYFATLDQKTKQKDETGKNHEFLLKTKRSSRRPDFFIPSINKIIEFDGIYWHGKIGRGNKTKDEARDLEIAEATENCKILHVREDEYYKNPDEVLNVCLGFILNG